MKPPPLRFSDYQNIDDDGRCFATDRHFEFMMNAKFAKTHGHYVRNFPYVLVKCKWVHIFTSSSTFQLNTPNTCRRYFRFKFQLLVKFTLGNLLLSGDIFTISTLQTIAPQLAWISGNSNAKFKMPCR